MTPQQPFLVPSIILAVLTIPLVLGIMPPNRWYGIRTKKTLSDRRIWQRANMFGGGCLGAASLVYILAGKRFPMPPPTSGDLTSYVLHFGVFLGPLLVAGLLTRSYIKRL
jgi:hypothetical protein